MVDFAGFPKPIKKKKKEENVHVKVPKDFLDVVDMKAISEGFSNRSLYLKKLADDIKPTAKDLRKRGLLRDEEQPPF